MNFPRQPSIEENKQPVNEKSAQPAQDKPKDADKKEAVPFKYCLPIQNPIDDTLKLMKLAHVKKSTTIKERHEGSGFTAISFKGGFSTDLGEPRKRKIMDEIDDQAWEEKFQKGESLFIYHGGSGQENNFGLELIPKVGQSKTTIHYYMGTLETTFTLAKPFMIVEKTRESFFRDTKKQEIVYLPATYGPKQQEELNKMKIAFFSSALEGLINRKRSLADRDHDYTNNEVQCGCGGGCDCGNGEPYKQLKS